MNDFDPTKLPGVLVMNPIDTMLQITICGVDSSGAVGGVVVGGVVVGGVVVGGVVIGGVVIGGVVITGVVLNIDSQRIQ